jgi:hypothetical protein
VTFANPATPSIGNIQPMKKTFLLGLGAQKCGTTWLNNYLMQNKTFARGFAKEYHIWDAIDLPILSRYQVKKSFFSSVNNKKRYKMQTDKNFYFEYFNSLYKNEVEITADITPAYSGLNSSRLSFIKQQFEERGIECKAVLFIRDPIERCRSAVQYNLGRGNFNEGVSIGNNGFCSALDEYYRTLHSKIRTNYSATIDNIKSVFSQDEYYIGVYESMFEKKNVGAISEFIGIDPIYSFSENRVNTTSGSRPTCEDVELKMRAYFEDVYEYCSKHIPETNELWQGFKIQS